MTLNRRDLLIAGTGIAGGILMPSGLKQLVSAADAKVDSIDRKALADRHSPVVDKLDPFSALTIGNGSFAFTADVTGLQTFPDLYKAEFPLCTCAHWAWHTIPAPAGISSKDFRYKMLDTHGRQVGYATDSKGQQMLFDWLRQNPHRLHLGQIGFVITKADGSIATAADITAIDQRLNLWTGALSSKFSVDGQPVLVRSCVHPDRNALAFRIESPMLNAGRIAIRIAFPYGSPEIDMADWKSTGRHETSCKQSDHKAEFSRSLDQDRYSAMLGWTAGKLEQTAAHEFLLKPAGESAECVMCFSQQPLTEALPSFGDSVQLAASHWQRFWSEGGAIDLSGSTDDRAAELERRIVLCQYNTAVHCAGPMPPQETGLLFNSWYGKSHLEMHWWHAAHFAAWGRISLLEKSLDYYHRILHVGQATAARQSYEGCRWPKMVGPDGTDSPSPIAPLLIWQQPHPIYYAELCYRQSPTKPTLDRFAEIVFETARFMASYPVLVDDRYVLGPPLKTVSENTDAHTTTNPAFELAYWRFGLRVAQQWRQRLGLAPEPKWADVLARLAPLPQSDGVYLMQEGMLDTYSTWAWEHPALLGCLGAQPGDGVDTETMRRTLKKVMQVWDWDRCWGWDFPMTALTAARLGEGELAVKALMIESPKNRYHPNGHVYQRPNLTAYLPANGGLLAAVATMALSAGGFPTDGKWNVKFEGLAPLL
jgi:hypothetical protein